MEIQKTIDFMLENYGDKMTFGGLVFNLDSGVLVIDTVKDYEFPLENGEVDIVDGFIVEFISFDELAEPVSFFALDEECIKAIIDDFIL